MLPSESLTAPLSAVLALAHPPCVVPLKDSSFTNSRPAIILCLEGKTLTRWPHTSLAHSRSRSTAGPQPEASLQRSQRQAAAAWVCVACRPEPDENICCLQAQARLLCCRLSRSSNSSSSEGEVSATPVSLVAKNIDEPHQRQISVHVGTLGKKGRPGK